MTNEKVDELVEICETIIDWIIDQPDYPDRARHLDAINSIKHRIDYSRTQEEDN